MSKDTQAVYEVGDLVRVGVEETPGWPGKPGEYLAIVVDDWAVTSVVNRVPVRSVNRPMKVNWVRPSRLELVQRGGQ